MDKALEYVQKFAADACKGRIPKDRLHFGSPWRHPPRTDNPTLCLEWAKLQLIDFVQSLVNAEFGVNYLADCSFEILDGPSAVALVELVNIDRTCRLVLQKIVYYCGETSLISAKALKTPQPKWNFLLQNDL